MYRGYVDDPRNTDNAWMETVAVHWHDEAGEVTARLPLRPGPAAASVTWMQLGADIVLYASHRNLVAAAVDRLGAHW